MKLSFLLLLCALVISCKSTKSVVTSTDSARISAEQVQRRYGRSISVDSLWRLTALSIDSLTLVFEGADTSATHEDGSSACPTSTASAVTKASPTKLKIYGIHLSREEKKNAVADVCLSDSNALSVQSSSDKSLSKSKAAPSSSPAKYLFALILIIAVAMLIRFISNKLRK